MSIAARPDTHRDDPTDVLVHSPAALLPPESLERVTRLVGTALRGPAELVLPSAVPRPNGRRTSDKKRERRERATSRDGARTRGRTTPRAGVRVLMLWGDSPAGGEAVIVTDTRRDARARQVPVAVDLGAGAFALIPVATSGLASHGAMCVLDAGPRDWTESEVGALHDVAAALATELDLRRHALHDPLTGLPNRGLFLDRLSHAVERAKRHKDFRFAVLSLDVDRFKLVNDSLGHQTGDELLVAIADRLRACVRGEDMVARLAGDEFAILLESLSHDSDGGRVAERIQRSLTTPVLLHGYEVVTSASIGVTLSSSGPESPAALLQSADIAMSRAKAAGRARYEMFDREMQARALGRLQAETDLRRALDRQELTVYYQPLVDLASGRITELEALVRWRHPQRGIVLPLDFIPLAEETGLILQIGRWVLAEACRQARAWQARFPRQEPLAVSVNLSVKELAQPGFVSQVAETVAHSGLDPRCLKLEITENLLIENSELTRTMLLELQRLGVRIYLDDFGTGYSSLSYLYRLPLDAIKIDRTFVTQMDRGEQHLQLVHIVRDLARNIGVSAVAEGVETETQLQVLRSLGCEFAQGYLFSKPVPPEEIERLLASDRHW
jgi:diguanylate cyclase (GGDEF)-like protein